MIDTVFATYRASKGSMMMICDYALMCVCTICDRLNLQSLEGSA
jgi:hypothetical protein